VYFDECTSLSYNINEWGRFKLSIDMNIEKQYLDLLDNILKNGQFTPDRTGTGTISIPHAMLTHDMSEGFPLFTTKRIAWKTVKVELEGFIKGITDKHWYQERGCKIWDEWCNPMLIPWWMTQPGHEDERKEYQLNENRLGKIYGYQWRQFGQSQTQRGKDQLQRVLDTLIKNPTDRRMLVSAWNPSELDEMALPPCHYAWQVTVLCGKLHLNWVQRSCDMFLGIPFNIASYGLLLEILAKYAGLQPGTLTGFLTNVHVYSNHVEQVKEQLSRTPFDLPTLSMEPTGVVDWTYENATLANYQHHPAIKAPVAV